MSILSKLMSFQTILSIIFIIILCIVVYYTYKRVSFNYNNYNKSGTNNNADISGDGSDTVTVYFFFASWCVYCKKATPTINEFKDKYDGTTLNGKNITFKYIDCSNENPDNKALMTRYSVEGFPTIVIVNKNVPSVYNNRITAGGLDDFINSVV
jgi:thiol-disulfide isomerase/thioredoxin